MVIEPEATTPQTQDNSQAIILVDSEATYHQPLAFTLPRLEHLGPEFINFINEFIVPTLVPHVSVFWPRQASWPIPKLPNLALS